MIRRKGRLLLMFIMLTSALTIYYTLWTSSSSPIIDSVVEHSNLLQISSTRSAKTSLPSRKRLQSSFSSESLQSTFQSPIHSKSLPYNEGNDIKAWLHGESEADFDRNKGNVDHENSQIQVTPLNNLKNKKSTEILTFKNENKFRLRDIRQRREATNGESIQTNTQNLSTHSWTSCLSPLLKGDSFIRNCITGNIIGKLPEDLNVMSLRQISGTSPETAAIRKKSFQKVFDTRAWGHDWDAQHKGLNASGKLHKC